MIPGEFWDQNVPTFNAIMFGAAKRRREDYSIAIASAWMGEFFQREKRLKQMAEYLPKPILSAAQERARKDATSQTLLAMMKRIQAKQNADGGKSSMSIKRVKRHG